MFWGLLKMMMWLVTLPLKLIRTMIRLMVAVLLPIVAMKVIKHLMNR